jgi:hypothetical protein
LTAVTTAGISVLRLRASCPAALREPVVRTSGRNENKLPAPPPEKSRVRFFASLLEDVKVREEEAST